LDVAHTDLPAAFAAPELDRWSDESVAHRAHGKALVRVVAIVVMVAVIAGSVLAGLLSVLRS
jgi:hypothetical protein